MGVLEQRIGLVIDYLYLPVAKELVIVVVRHARRSRHHELETVGKMVGSLQHQRKIVLYLM